MTVCLKSAGAKAAHLTSTPSRKCSSVATFSSFGRFPKLLSLQKGPKARAKPRLAVVRATEKDSLLPREPGREGAGPQTDSSQAADDVQVHKESVHWLEKEAPPGTKQESVKGELKGGKGKETQKPFVIPDNVSPGASAGEDSVNADMRHGQEAGSAGRAAVGAENLPSQLDLEPSEATPQEIGSPARPAESASKILGHQAEEMNLPGAIMDPGEPVGQGPQGQSSPGGLPESLPEDMESLMSSSSEDDTADSPTARSAVDAVTEESR